jgi:DNA-binding NarL/FixJ family response regulator
MRILINLGSVMLGKALQSQLEREPDGYEVLADTGNPGPDSCRPDFVILDCHTIRRAMPSVEKGTKIVLIDYGLSEGEIASFLLSHRIDGIMSTTADIHLLKKALQAIRAGQIWIDNRKIKALVNHAEGSKDSGRIESLSRKERDIVMLIARGLTNREIASISCISEQTVKTHVGRIFRKLNVSRRSQLVPLAMNLMISDAP